MFADFTMTELMTIIGPVAVAGAGAIYVLWQQNNKGWEARVALLVAQLLTQGEDLKSYKQMNTEMLTLLRMLADKRDVEKGKIPIPKLLAVVAEHSSVPTKKQVTTADIATQRADLVDLVKRLDESEPEPKQAKPVEPEQAKENTHA